MVWDDFCVTSENKHLDLERSTWSEFASILKDNNKNYIESYKTFKKPEEKFNPKYREVLTSYGACMSSFMLNISIFKEKWMDEAYGLMKDGEAESNWTSDSNTFKPDLNSHAWKTSFFKFSVLKNKFCHKVNNITSFKLIIHPPDHIPTIFHDSIDMDYNDRNIAVVKMKSERSSENLRVLDPDIRKCYFEDEGNLKYFKRYSRQYCIMECKARNLRCHPLEVPASNATNLTFCPVVYAEQSYKNATLAKQEEECKCYPSCNYLEFKIKKEIDEEKYDHTFLSVSTFDGANHLWTYVEENQKYMAYTLVNCKNFLHKTFQ